MTSTPAPTSKAALPEEATHLYLVEPATETRRSADLDDTLPLASARARKAESLLDATWLSVPRREPEPVEEKRSGGWKKIAVAAVLLIGIAAAGLLLWRSRASSPEPQVQAPAPAAVPASSPVIPEESPTPVPVAAAPEPSPSPTPAPVKPREPARREIAPEDAVTLGEAPLPMRRGDLILRGLPNVVEPEPRDFPAYSYPAAAKGSGKVVRVRVRVLVDEEGRVIETALREKDGSGLGFDEIALETARKTPFHPATRDEIPGRMWTELIFEFSE